MLKVIFQWSLFALVIPIIPLEGLPQSPTVQVGEATFTQQGGRVHSQVTDGTIIDYESFSIDSGESVYFQQNSESSRILNRVTGSQLSTINGQLSSNGALYLANPYGIFFGEQAVVQTADFYAIAGHISDTDFLMNIDKFTNLQGAVVNQGFIMGSQVTLLGKHVENQGFILSSEGSISIYRSGNDLLLHEKGAPFYFRASEPVESIETLPSELPTSGDFLGCILTAESKIRAKDIVIHAEDAPLHIAGEVKAHDDLSSASSVLLLGKEVNLSGAAISATGNEDGGKVTIGGGNEREGELYYSSDLLLMNEQTTIEASAAENGQGGTIFLHTEGVIAPKGTYQVNGGSEMGDGGAVVLSGQQGFDLTQSFEVNALSTRGQSGTLTLNLNP